MTDDPIARLIAGLTIIAPPDGWVARATDRHERTTTMNTATDYANPTRLVAHEVNTFAQLMSDAAAYDAIGTPGPRADARLARLGAARITGSAILFGGADASTSEQAERVIARALLIARDREPDHGGALDAMFAQLRDNRGADEIAAKMAEAIGHREALGLPVVEWRAALDVMRAVIDPSTAPWVAVGQ
jgi:hypothetical protein